MIQFKWLKQLSVREKLLIYTAGGLLAVLLCYQFSFVPLQEKKKQKEMEMIRLQKEFVQLKKTSETYLKYQGLFSSLERRYSKKDSLPVLTYLENEAEKQEVRSNIEYIKPKGTQNQNYITRTMVEIKINAIPVHDLNRFLYNLENNRPGLIISYLRVKPYYKDRSRTDAIVTVTDVKIARDSSG
ncbi:MAG: type II secretion system protein GspM [Spirochaetota bacterium]